MTEFALTARTLFPKICNGDRKAVTGVNMTSSPFWYRQSSQVGTNGHLHWYRQETEPAPHSKSP